MELVHSDVLALGEACSNVLVQGHSEEPVLEHSKVLVQGQNSMVLGQGHSKEPVLEHSKEPVLGQVHSKELVQKSMELVLVQKSKVLVLHSIELVPELVKVIGGGLAAMLKDEARQATASALAVVEAHTQQVGERGGGGGLRVSMDESEEHWLSLSSSEPLLFKGEDFSKTDVAITI